MANFLKKDSSKIDTYSKEYPFFWGSYEWLNNDKSKNFTFQTLLCNASYANLKNDIKTLNDLAEYNSLGFELLVQRDIDINRVNIDIVENYLKVKDKLNFFPPIIVVLIPKFEDLLDKKFQFKKVIEGNELVISLNNDTVKETFDFDKSDSSDLREYFSSNIRGGKITWDKSKIHALVIDGQHRLKALEIYLREKGQEEIPSNLVPVNFVLLQPHFENFTSEFNGYDYVRAARELFIDINKNAKTVSDTRLILLDDRSLKRTLVRRAIRQYNRLEYAPEEYYQWNHVENIEYLKKIPQEVISWNIQEDFSRASQEYRLAQLTSTTLLYEVISEYILQPRSNEDMFENLYEVMELRDYEPENDHERLIFAQIENKRDNYRKKLAEIDEEEKQAEEDDYIDEDLFNRRRLRLKENALDFEKDVNDWISNWFYSETFTGKYIVYFFTSFRPYYNILKSIEGLFDEYEKYKDIINLIVDPKFKHETQYTDNLTHELQPKFTALYVKFNNSVYISEDVKFIVFQKAIFSSIETTKLITKELFEHKDVDESIVEYVDLLSELYDNGLFDRSLKMDLTVPVFENTEVEINRTYFWLGIWVTEKTDGSLQIKYRTVDAQKIGDFIKIIAYLKFTNTDFSSINESHFLWGRKKKIVDSVRRYYVNSHKSRFELNTQDDTYKHLGMDKHKYEKEIHTMLNDMIKQKLKD